METNVQTDKKPKKGKKFEAAAATPEVQSAADVMDAAAEETKEVVEKAKGLPRPRKHDYGITDEAQIVRIAEAPRVAKDIETAWGHTNENPTVKAYFDLYGEANRTEARHGLRVMSRRKLIKIVHADGTEYPREYVAPPPKAEAAPAAEPSEAPAGTDVPPDAPADQPDQG